MDFADVRIEQWSVNVEDLEEAFSMPPTNEMFLQDHISLSLRRRLVPLLMEREFDYVQTAENQSLDALLPPPAAGRGTGLQGTGAREALLFFSSPARKGRQDHIAPADDEPPETCSTEKTCELVLEDLVATPLSQLKA